VFEKTGYSAGILDDVKAAVHTHQTSEAEAHQLPKIRTLEGTEFSLAALPPAKFYVFEMWTTYCEPCPRLMKETEAWAAGLPEGEVMVVKVSGDDYAFPGE
jgi:hypothetical protein